MKKKETSLAGVATLAAVISVFVGASYELAPYFYSAVFQSFDLHQFHVRGRSIIKLIGGYEKMSDNDAQT